MTTTLRERIDAVRLSMADACARRGRPAESVRLLCATKTVAPEVITEAFAAGCRLFGENRVQEREAKRASLECLNGAQWHLLGPLQQNKAGRALGLFACIESVDALALAQRLDRLASNRLATAPVPVLLEINIGREPQKHGVLPEAALELAQGIQTMERIEIRGVMTVPPWTENPEGARPYFAALAELGEKLRLTLHRPREAWELSMGMSHDYAVAIEEGATLVRVGTALFGPR